MLNHIIALLDRCVTKIRHSPAIVILAIYFLLATFVTYPFLLSPRDTLTAPLLGDISGSVAVYGAFVREKANPFTATRLMSIAQPDGIANNPGVNRVSFFSVAYLLLASYAFGPIAAHSLETFLGYLLTAFIMFLFVRAVTKSTMAGFVSGLVYGFWPLMLGLGRAASTYTHMWLYLLPMWAFWSLAIHYTHRRAILAAASIVPAIFWTPYYAFHIFLVGVSGLLVACWYIMKKSGTKKTLLMAGSIVAVWIAIYATYYAIGTTGTSDAAPVRTLQDAYDQSAHPLMYILPGASASWDKGLNDLLVQLVPRAINASLYVGLSVLILAIFGIFKTLAQRGDATPNAKHIAVVMGMVVATCCFVFSLVPTYTVSGHVIPLPGYLVVKAVPALRAGQRLAMPLMGALALLAGIGAYHVLNRFPGWRRYIALAALICILAADLWSISRLGKPDRSASVDCAITGASGREGGAIRGKFTCWTLSESHLSRATDSWQTPHK